MSERKITKDDCDGCRDDFYNGKNDLGVKECWRFKSATFGEYRLIHINQPPPYLRIKVEKLPKCFHRPQFVKVAPEALDEKGFWRS